MNERASTPRTYRNESHGIGRFGECLKYSIMLYVERLIVRNWGGYLTTRNG